MLATVPSRTLVSVPAAVTVPIPVLLSSRPLSLALLLCLALIQPLKRLPQLYFLPSLSLPAYVPNASKLLYGVVRSDGSGAIYR
jgi:hypothetical protein